MRHTRLLLAFIFAGCAGAVPYGSFVTGREPAQAAIAADAAKELAASLRSTGEPIRFAHDASDAFGRSLAAALRTQGFAIRVTPAHGELLVRYVVDAVKGTDLLRATIYVQGRTLSRAYAQRASGLYPVGPWSVGGPYGS
jgi:hypothetical protein